MAEFDPSDTLPPRQRNWVVLLSFGILYLTLDLVRRRKVREDDSWMWLLIGSSIFVFGTQYRLLKRISGYLGIVAPTSTTFFFGQMFLMLLAMQLLSLSTPVKELMNYMPWIKMSSPLPVQLLSD